MIKVRNLGLLLALSSVTALPACSWFGGGNSSESSSAAAPSPSYAAAPAPQQQAEVQQPVTPDTIRQVQQTLQQQGLYHARVDGVWGPQTQAAVRSYQQNNNLNASGQLDQQTMASLTQGNGQSYNQQQQPSQQNAQSNQQGGSVTR
jgi:peptidoglycan hydrolase-like protein with peptidoglycan-binding domain